MTNLCDYSYRVGEIVRFEFDARSSKTLDPLVITSAVWKLKAFQTGEVLEQGEADYYDNQGSFIVPFNKGGKYKLELWVDAPPEIKETEIIVEVKC